MKRVVAMYEENGNYARKLAEYVSRKESVPFELQFFSDADKLSSYLQTHKPEYLVLSENDAAQQFHNYTAGDLMYLSEQKTDKKNNKKNEIYKYQATENVLHQLISKMNCKEGHAEAGGLGEADIYGVYSPIGRCGKTMLALLLGDALAKDRSVLYMSFDEFGGAEGVVGEHQYTMSDVIFCYRQGKLAERLREMTVSWHHVDLVTGVSCPEDLQLIKGEEWRSILQLILNACEYDAIILDLGCQLWVAQEVFAFCSRIFVPMLDRRDATQQIQRFDAWLERDDKKIYQPRIQKVQVPYKENGLNMEAQLEYALWGDAGDYVRGLIRQVG